MMQSQSSLLGARPALGQRRGSSAPRKCLLAMMLTLGAPRHESLSRASPLAQELGSRITLFILQLILRRFLHQYISTAGATVLGLAAVIGHGKGMFFEPVQNVFF